MIRHLQCRQLTWYLPDSSLCLQDLEETPLTFVETVQTLQSMVQHLATAKEVALDLEHHHYRSFQGFTCLMQLSTRQDDFIVDTLALRTDLGAALTPIFADPKVSERFLLLQASCVCDVV